MTTNKGFAGIFSRGIDHKALEQRAKASRATGDRLGIAKGETKIIQFYGAPDPDSPYWMEFRQHVWKENGKWFFVPCKGDDNGCSLCQDERDNVVKTSDGFICAVWSFKDKSAKVLGGPQALLTRIIYRWQRAEDRFTRRTWEISRFNSDKTEYDVTQGEERPIRLGEHPAVDLQKYLLGEVARYEATLSSPASKRKGPSSLDDMDDEEDEIEEDEEDEIEEDEEELEDDEEGPTEEDLMDREEYPLSELLAYAKSVGAKIPSTETKNRKMIVRRITTKRGY